MIDKDGHHDVRISSFFSTLHDMLNYTSDVMLTRRLMGLAQNLCQDDFGKSWFLRFEQKGVTFKQLIFARTLTTICDRQTILSSLQTIAHLSGVEGVSCFEERELRILVDFVGCGDVEIATKAVECVVKGGGKVGEGKGGREELTDLLVCGVIANCLNN